MSISAEDRLGRDGGRVSDPDPEVPERAKRRSYTARYKLEILDEYETLDRVGRVRCCVVRGCIRRCSLNGGNNATRVLWRRWRRNPAGNHSTRPSGTMSGCVNVSDGSRTSWGQHVG
jgi:hypothetical protein